MTDLPDLSHLSHDEKDALIRALWAQVQTLTARVAELEARLSGPPKTPDNSSVPPSQGSKAHVGLRRQLQWQLRDINVLHRSCDYAGYQQSSAATGLFTKRPLRWQAL